jgi:hypothetical protein
MAMSDQPRPTEPEQDGARWLRGLRDLTQNWLRETDGLVRWEKQNNQPVRVDEPVPTDAYTDLDFAFGLAQVRAVTAVRELLEQARERLAGCDDAHQFLLRAYQFRISQALAGKPHAGPLPDEYVEYMESMDRLLRYVADRLRQHSRVLEPDQRINPYRHWGARINDLEKALVELTDLTDRDEIVASVDRLLKDVPKGAKGHEVRAKILKAGLEAAPRVSEDFARRMLDQAVPAYDALPEQQDLAAVMEQAAFLEKVLFSAAHYGSDAHIHPLVARFERMLQSQRGPQGLEALSSVADQCFRGLRKLGMRDTIDRLLGQLADAVLEGKELAAVDFHKLAQGPDMLKALLQVAAGWCYLGFVQEAETIIEASRLVLFQPEPAYKSFDAWSTNSHQRTSLARSYAAALGQLPMPMAGAFLEELFTRLRGVHDAYTTNRHFSVAHLDVIEAGVLAAVEVLTRPDKPLTVTT